MQTEKNRWNYSFFYLSSFDLLGLYEELILVTHYLGISHLVKHAGYNLWICVNVHYSNDVMSTTLCYLFDSILFPKEYSTL